MPQAQVIPNPAVLLIAAAAILGALFLTGARTERADAASCSNFTIDDDSTPGNLILHGAGACSDHAERFRVFCEAGIVKVDYAFIDDNTLSGVHDTGISCGSVQTLSISGLLGGDLIDVTSVVPAAGGFGTLSRSLSGGPGNDTMQVRNGVSDSVDCGDDTDSAEADRVGTDSLANCEIVSLAPEPAMALPAAAVAPTSKKCKKKRRSAAVAKKKRCKKKR
jgi:hypothetical protein